MSVGRILYEELRRASVQEDHKRIRIAMEWTLSAAAQGDKWAIEFVRDTLDGRPKQVSEISGPGGEAVPLKGIIEFVKADGVASRD